MEVENQHHGYFPSLYRQATEKLPSTKLREEISATLKKVVKEEVLPSSTSREEFDACLIHLMPLIKNNPFGIDIKEKPIYAGDIPLWRPYKPDTPTFLMNMKMGKMTGKRLEPGYVMFPMPKKNGRRSKMTNMDVTSDDKQHLCPKKVYHALFYVIENSIDRLKALAEKEKSRSRMSRGSNASHRMNKITSPIRRFNNNGDITERSDENASTPRDEKPENGKVKFGRKNSIRSSSPMSHVETQMANENNVQNGGHAHDTTTTHQHRLKNHPKHSLLTEHNVHRANQSRLSKSTALSSEDDRESMATVETFLPPIHDSHAKSRDGSNRTRGSQRSEKTHEPSDFELLQSRSSFRTEEIESRQSKRTDKSTKVKRKSSVASDTRRLSKGSEVNLVPIPIIFGVNDRQGSKGHIPTLGGDKTALTKSGNFVNQRSEATELNMLLKVPSLTDSLVRKRSDAGAETVNTKRDKLTDDSPIHIPDLKLIVENDEHFLLVVMESGRAIEIIPSIAETAAGPFYVAKPHVNDENPGSDFRWRISFAPNEEIILNTITSGDKNQRLMAAKVVTSLCQNEWKLSPITQYHIKTVLLHEIDHEVDNTPRWQRLSLDECVKLILLRLLHFVQNKSLPHFFEDEFNLWSHLNERQFRFMKSTLQKMTEDDDRLIRALKRMRVQPVVFE